MRELRLSDPGKYRLARQLRDKPTEAERVLWGRLRARRCGGFKFKRQTVLQGYIADFYCPGCRLIVEADGPIHDRQEEYDRDRDEHLSWQGIKTLRFTNREILRDIDGVIRWILLVCQERALDKPNG